MKEMWDNRYSHDEYAYGENPNVFFSQQLANLEKGKILLPAEGEGRNAVYAALHGWQTDAFDFSNSAKEKALKLADKHGVIINYSISSLLDFTSGKVGYDCIALIYVHIPVEIRPVFHEKISKLLAPGGTLILEGFSKKQHGKSSGGPKIESMLFSANELRSDFEDLSITLLIEEDTILNEGEFHKGNASVVRLLATKPFN